MEVPAIGLGTWRMEGDECANAVQRALDMGYRHVDTAEMYDNEAAVGRGIAESAVARDDVFLTTKVWRTHLTREGVLDAVEASLDRLGTGYVDLLLVHWPSTEVPIEETLGAMEEVVDEGLVRHIGVSNFTPDLLDEARAVSDAVACDQVETHVYNQQDELQQYCADNDMILTAYSPLARGDVAKDPVLREIADDHNVTAAQVALRFLIQRDNVVAIPKAVPEDYQRQNLEAMEFELTADEMGRIRGLDEGRRKVDPDFAPW